MVRFSTSFLCLERDKTTTVVCLLPKIVLLSSFVSLSLNDARASLRTGCDDTMRPPFVVAPARFGWCKGVVARVFFARVQAFQEEEEGDGGHTRCWGRVIDRRRRRRRTKKAKNRISFWFFHPKRDLKNRLSKKRFQKKKKERKRKPSSKKKTND